MRLLFLLPLIVLCHGAALPESENLDLDTVIDTFQDFALNPDRYMEAFGIRTKRDTSHTGFKEFPLPFLGAEIGIKYKDQSNRAKGGEAFLHIDDLQSIIPAAHSKMVKVHIKFDGGDHTTDGLFTAEVDYHLEHKDGDGTEEGSLKVVRAMRGGKWHTNIKTETKPFSGVPIIPARISNLELDLESDRKTSLNAKYINIPMGRDISVVIDRVPGKSIKAVIVRGGVTSTINGFLSKPAADEIEIDIDADIRGQKYSGKISGKLQAGKSTKLKVDLKKGSESMLQVQMEVKMAGNKGKFRGKYSVMGGKVAQGDYSGKFDNGKFEFDAAPYKLEVALKLGESIDVVAKKDNVKMWSYKTHREDKSTPANIIYEANSEMTLNSASMLHKAIEKYYPFGAFQTRTNTFKIVIDKHNRNFLFRKFKVDFEVVKDGAKVVDIEADTTGDVYKFEVAAPNLFNKLGIHHNSITATVDHVRGSHLLIDTNLGGGIHFAATQAPNGQGGRSINIVATKAGAEMFKYHGETSKIDNADILKVGLKGDFTLSPESILYKLVVGKYKILTPFAKRTSDLEFYWNKKDKNVILNKFYGKAKIDKDGVNVFNLDISTNQKPYKLYVFFPAVLGKLRPGMTEVDVTVDHEKGQYLEMKVNHAGAKFKGFKISKVGGGTKREIVWNGKKLGSGDYTLDDHKFTTTQTLDDGRALTTTITWTNKWDSPEFFKNNKVHVVLDGTERQLNLNLDWGMNKIPDLDFGTPENGHFKMNAVGHNARWGDYSISRDLTWNSANQKVAVDLTGEASFEAGNLASRSPIHTEIKLTYDKPTNDLEGKIKKVMAGKEYSITFPHGSFKMPSIKIGA